MSTAILLGSADHCAAPEGRKAPWWAAREVTEKERHAKSSKAGRKQATGISVGPKYEAQKKEQFLSDRAPKERK